MCKIMVTTTTMENTHSFLLKADFLKNHLIEEIDLVSLFCLLFIAESTQKILQKAVNDTTLVLSIGAECEDLSFDFKIVRNNPHVVWIHKNLH